MNRHGDLHPLYGSLHADARPGHDPGRRADADRPPGEHPACTLRPAERLRRRLATLVARL